MPPDAVDRREDDRREVLGRMARQRHARALLGLAAVNALAALVHASGYQRAVEAAAAGRAYLALALVGQLWVAFLLLAALLLPLAWPPAGRAALYALAPLAAAAGQLFFFVDQKVYAALGVHLGSLPLDVVLTPGGLRALDATPAEWQRLGVAWSAALLAEAALYAGAVSLASRRPGPVRQGWVRAAAAVALLLSAERAIYAAATLRGWGVGAAAAAAPAFDLERTFRLRTAAPETLRYPREPLDVDAAAPRPNLLWIVVESWRSDGLDPAITPALWRQRQRSLAFTNHVSGGNASIVGVFSQFYGLHGNAVEPLVRAGQGPLLFQVLRQRGYRIGVVASPSLEYAGMRAAVFKDLAGAVDDQHVGVDPAARDLEVARKAEAFLQGGSGEQPFALVVFLDGTHIPYFFVPSEARFHPYLEQLRYSELDERPGPDAVEQVRNRYRNALAAVDRAAGLVLEAVERRGQGDHTVTIVTGDHGEQLYEHGRLGHGISLSPVETATPLLLRAPGVPPGARAGLSRHVDLAPTTMGLLGVRTPPAEYSVGRSLLRDPPPPFAVLVSPMHRGVRTADGWTAVWETGDVAAQARAGVWVHDPGFRQVGLPPDGGAEAEAARQLVTEALQDLRAFSR